MKKTAIMSILPYLKNAYPIGKGKTSICYLMKDGRVLKLYLNTRVTQRLYEKYENIIEHFEQINTIKNNTYIAPEELLIKDNKCIGYIYSYKAAKTLNRLNKKTPLELMINSYDKLERDTIIASKNKFVLNDIHDRNILFNYEFYIIDLDFGFFTPSKKDEGIIKYNMLRLNSVLIHSLFNQKSNTHMNFKDKDLDIMYKKSICEDYKKCKELLKALKDIGINNKKDLLNESKQLIYTK